MPVKNYDFTKDYSFHGEFWHDPTDNKGRFSAKIEYSSYNGLTLDYCISDSDSPKKCERLYGILNTGEPCTLIGEFDFTHSAIRLGKVKVLTGLHQFSIMIFGGFYDESKNLDSCYLSLHGLQEFIHPQGRITQLKFSTKPILSTKGDNWKIDLINTASFDLVGDSLTNIINCQIEDALEKFKNDFSETKSSFPNALFSIRKNLKFYLRYEKISKDTIENNISDLWKISSLFSILLNKPILPDDLHLRFEGNKERSPCLFTIGVEQRTIDLATRNIHHHYLPLDWKQIDFNKIINKWFEIGENYKSLSVTYQNETNYRTLHQAHADIILYATQLEAINHSLNGKKEQKYMTPINEYASPTLKQNLEQAFINLNDKSIGENIATLRNELAHVDRTKVLMKTMKIDDYIKIGLYLKIIVTSHLLFNLGLNKEQIERYQDKVAP
ncbi:hypothetical protein HIJ22_003137 [Escherichia coli]|nr:hypothetical protein [Escherichia coli]